MIEGGVSVGAEIVTQKKCPDAVAWPLVSSTRQGAWPRLSMLPVTLGITGTGACLRQAELLWGMAHLGSALFMAIGAALAALAGFGYALRALRDFACIRAEFLNPSEACLFCGWSLSLLLLGADAGRLWPLSGIWLWYAAIVVHVVVTAVLLRTAWLFWPERGTKATPSWVMPSTGCLLVPVWAALHGDVIVAWTFFVIGMLLCAFALYAWLERLRTSGRPPVAIASQFLIVVSPPAVGGIAWLRLTGQASLTLEAFFFLLLAVYLATALQLWWMRADCRFAWGWWATAFPTAALASLGLQIADNTHGRIFTAVAGILVLGLLVIVGTLFALSLRHVRGVRRRSELTGKN